MTPSRDDDLDVKELEALILTPWAEVTKRSGLGVLADLGTGCLARG